MNKIDYSDFINYILEISSSEREKLKELSITKLKRQDIIAFLKFLEEYDLDRYKKFEKEYYSLIKNSIEENKNVVLRDITDIVLSINKIINIIFSNNEFLEVYNLFIKCNPMVLLKNSHYLVRGLQESLHKLYQIKDDTCELCVYDNKFKLATNDMVTLITRFIENEWEIVSYNYYKKHNNYNYSQLEVALEHNTLSVCIYNKTILYDISSEYVPTKLC